MKNDDTYRVTFRSKERGNKKDCLKACDELMCNTRYFNCHLLLTSFRCWL